MVDHQTQQDAALPLRVLGLELSIGPTSAPYNEYTLAAENLRASFCTYFKPKISPDRRIRLFAGDDTVSGFLRSLDAALATDTYDVIHAHTVHVASLFSYWRMRHRRRSLPPTVFTMHCAYHNYRARNKLMLMPALATFDHVVYCSESVLESLPKPLLQLRRGPFSIIPNGADLNRIERARLALEESSTASAFHAEFRIGSVGRLIPSKNMESVLQAFGDASKDDWRLVYLGDGPQGDALRRLAKELSIEPKVELAGCLPRDQLFCRLFELDAFVSMSLREGLPVAVLEAMACGLPVVLSDIPPHREIARTTDGVRLVDPADVAGLQEELIRLYALHPLERRRIGQECRRAVVEHFAVSTMLSRYDQLYRSLNEVRLCD